MPQLLGSLSETTEQTQAGSIRRDERHGFISLPAAGICFWSNQE
jgi:hypothetical protein